MNASDFWTILVNEQCDHYFRNDDGFVSGRSNGRGAEKGSRFGVERRENRGSQDKCGWFSWLLIGRYRLMDSCLMPFECFVGEVSGENVSASSGPRGGDRGEATDLGTHTENNDGATLAANTAVDARGGSPQGAHLSGAATPRPPRGRRRQNQNGLDTTQCDQQNATMPIGLFSSGHPQFPATPLISQKNEHEKPAASRLKRSLLSPKHPHQAHRLARQMNHGGKYFSIYRETGRARSPGLSFWSLFFRKKLAETGGRAPWSHSKRCTRWDRVYVARASAPCQEEVSRRERDLPWPVGAAPRTPWGPYSTPIESRSSWCHVAFSPPKRSQLLRHALPSLPYLRCNLFPGINAH
ncbi:hypothetical protein WN48_06119 [Eufriesea mexicana]|nr:hypothetical protein WN48_06119 [Eufriesea mexicana]